MAAADAAAGRALLAHLAEGEELWLNIAAEALEEARQQAAAQERERLERKLWLRLAAEPNPTRQIGLRDAIAILAEPTDD